jgi:hypothetical protein
MKLVSAHVVGDHRGRAGRSPKGDFSMSRNSADMPRASLFAAVAVLCLGGLISAPAALAAGHGGNNAVSSGQCAVAPGTVASGQQYTITGSGLGAYALVNVTISDGEYFSVAANANGAISFTNQSYTRGMNTVNFVEGGRHRTVVAACTFQVT